MTLCGGCRTRETQRQKNWRYEAASAYLTSTYTADVVVACSAPLYEFHVILQSKREQYEIQEIDLEKESHRCLHGTDLLTLQDRSALNKHYSIKLKKLPKVLDLDNARNSEAEANPCSSLCVTLQIKKRKHKKLNRKRERFLHDIDLLSLDDHERHFLCDCYCKQAQKVREKKHKVIQQEIAEYMASEARQTQDASLPLIQGGTHGRLASGLLDEKVRNM